MPGHAVGDFVEQVEPLFRHAGREQVERTFDAFAHGKFRICSKLQLAPIRSSKNPECR
jgi:hypothetical protein